MLLTSSRREAQGQPIPWQSCSPFFSVIMFTDCMKIMFKQFIGLCFPFLQRLTGRSLVQYYDIEYKGHNVYLTPKGKHESTLIWMHGLGDTAESYLHLFTQASGLVFSETTKIVLLEAPERPVTINYGQKTNSWFDIIGFDFRGDFEKNVSVSEIADSKKIIDEVLNEECKLIDSSKVYIGGFSQGCAMALHCGLTYERHLGGVIGVSGFLFPITKFSEQSKDTPVQIYHGEEDCMIPWLFAKTSYKMLQFHCKYLIIKASPQLDHTISLTQLEDIKTFMEDRLRNTDQSHIIEETAQLKQKDAL